MYIYEELVTKVVIVFTLFVVSLSMLFISVHMFIVMPVQLYHKAKCIEAGYPKAYVTYDFKAYCINLDGSVTAKVIPIEKLK